MNITHLTLIQQIALAATNSSLKIMNTGSTGAFNSRQQYRPIDLKNPKPTLSSQAFKTLNSIQLVIDETLSKTPQANTFAKPPSLSFISGPSGAVKVTVYESLKMKESLTDTGNNPTVVFDRFGIHTNISITGDLKDSLQQISTVFTCLVDFSNGDSNNILDVVKELLTGLEVIEKLDTTIDEMFPSIQTNYNTFNIIADSVIFKDWEYNDDTGQVINMPPVICERTYENILNVSHTYANEVSNLNRLHVSYSEPEDKKIGLLRISVSFNKSEKKLITEVEIPVELDPIDFMKLVANTLANGLNALPNKDRFEKLTSHLVNNILDAAEFLESTDVN